VPIHAPFEFRHSPAIAIAHELIHVRLQHAQIAQHLRFKLIHHPHCGDPPVRMALPALKCSIAFIIENHPITNSVHVNPSRT
jgi:hypothetical protein